MSLFIGSNLAHSSLAACSRNNNSNSSSTHRNPKVYSLSPLLSFPPRGTPTGWSVKGLNTLRAHLRGSRLGGARSSPSPPHQGEGHWSTGALFARQVS
ncbi:hypothetical protein FKM82_029838 [Ascaphus truei]